MNPYETEHNKLVRECGAECAVLLQSDGSFPLEAPCRVALFGNGARRTIKGGTGSGEVNSRSYVTIEQGLENAGFTVTGKGWMDRYGELYDGAKKRFIKGLKRTAMMHGKLAVFEYMGAVMPEPEYDLPLEGEGDAAVYVLSRISGEGSDRKPVPGDILLTETEVRDIHKLQDKFPKFILVLNVGGVVDLAPVMDVKNILLLSQLGAETGNILADLILGKSVPSGRLATSWTTWCDYSTIGEFGDRDETRYEEGIYVGYRYFDSIGKPPIFPFGYGLGYTEFSIKPGEVTEQNGIVNLDCSVRNTGTYKGKETVQLYVSAPRGKLGKAYQVLAAFDKSRELQPGEEQELTLTFDLRDIASYDEATASHVLEAGYYVLRMGQSSADTQDVAALQLERDIVVRKCKNCLGKPDFEDWKPEQVVLEENPDVPFLKVDVAGFKTEEVDYTPLEEVDPRAEALTDEELCLMNIGAFKTGKESQSAVGNAGNSVAGAAGETTSALYGKGISTLVMADGPAGLRISRQYTRDDNGVHALGDGLPESILELMPAPAAFFMRRSAAKQKVSGKIYEQYCTAIPIGTALAQSWNLALAESCGDIVGNEMERFGVHLWLAPALNIHRDIRCGRNFEYFSEDPLISGKFAAALTRGVQKHPGCGVTMKHYAANNQETNRYGSNSQVSERALREIYLKGFEIAVKESHPKAVMTSYNLINGVHTSERYDLTEEVLRCEFGFDGIVMTDWIVRMMAGKDNKYAGPNAAKVAAAGNDLLMPGGKADLEEMMAGLQAGLVNRRRLLINVSRVLHMIDELTQKK